MNPTITSPITGSGGGDEHRVSRVPRHHVGQLFLKGPIPWDWLAKAAHAPGRALHVALAVWFEAFVKSARTVQLSRARLDDLGLDRHTTRRGLACLERLGLVSLERRPGCRPQITVLDLSASKPRSEQG